MTAVRTDRTTPTAPGAADPSTAGAPTAIASFALAAAVVANVEGWPSLPSATMELLIVGAALVAVAGASLSRLRLRFAPVAIALLLTYAGVTLASVLVADDTDLAQDAWMKLVRAMAIGAIAYLLVARRGGLHWTSWGAVLGAGVVSVGALLGGPPPLSGLDAVDLNGRLVGPLGDGNFFAQHLLVGLALAVGCLRRERLASRVLTASVVVALTFLAILATESRGAIVALAVVVVAALSGLRPRARLAVAVLVVVVAALVLPGTTLGERLGRAPGSVASALDQGVAEDTAVAGRLSENIAAVQMAADDPFLGVGFGTYQREYLEHARSIALDARLEERDSHNLHLEVLAETGVLGALVWVAIVLTVGRELLATARADHVPADERRLANGWWLAFLAFLVTALFLHDNHPELQWLVVGVGFGIAERRRQSRTDGVPAAADVPTAAAP